MLSSNNLSPLLAIIALFGFNASFPFATDVGSHNLSPFGTQRPRWHSFPSSINGDLTIHSPSGTNVLAGTPPVSTLIRGSASLLAHRPMSGSDTICNSPNPPLADFVLFGLSLSSFPFPFPSRFFKHAFARKKFSHSYK